MYMPVYLVTCLFDLIIEGGHPGGAFLATDGNFLYCHHHSSSDCPSFYDLGYFLPKNEVNAMGVNIMQQWKKTLKLQHVTTVPDEAIDSCEASYEAADGKKQKTSMESFDDTGLMVLICCHDIPLFFANINTPSEQQKYALALIAHLFSLLPPSTTVVVLYDVGCVLNRTLSLMSVYLSPHLHYLICFNQYDILPENVVGRLRFATTAMHAYGHKWACQLVFNPCLSVRLGLTDGEGTEWLWSHMIKLIGIEHSSLVRLSLTLIVANLNQLFKSSNATFGLLTNKPL